MRDRSAVARAKRARCSSSARARNRSVSQKDTASALAVGLSLLSGAHLTLFPRVMEELRSRDLDLLVFGGGVIPDGDAAALRSQGVAEIFGPGSSLKGISGWLEAQLDQREDEA